ncbi:DUF1015 domain-containing protein [Candidatus Altiarchaeota archaeon]
MVEVVPFPGVFYDTKACGPLEDIVSLPYDVISPKKQEEYYQASEYNVIRLILGKTEPKDNGENRYTRARAHFTSWLEKGILRQDDNKGFYVYQEEYDLEGVTKKQTGFIGLVKLEPFEDGNILPHERIFNTVIDDRYKLLDATQANLEAIMSMYSDPGQEIGSILGQAMESEPLACITHEDGIIHRIWAIHDPANLEQIVKLMEKKKLYIADGHHRYTTSLRYSQDNDKHAAKHIMMLLLNMDDDLTILPPHRLLRNLDCFEPDTVIGEVRKYFNVKEYSNGKQSSRKKLVQALGERQDKHVFGMVLKDKCFLIYLKKSDIIEDLMDCSRSSQWNELDVTILQDVLIGYLLGVKHQDKQNISYEKDLSKVFASIDSGENQVAFLLNPPKVPQVKSIADIGDAMPQKSTYFYPKIISGLIMYKF